MNSDLLSEIVELIRDASKTNEKKSILGDYIDSPELQRVLVAALTPTISYGVANLPTVIKHGSKVFDDSTWDLIHRLETRQLTGAAARVELLGERVKLTQASSELLVCILQKDFCAGLGVKLVNTVRPGLINTVPYMRCNVWKDNTVDWSRGIYVQTKCDGLYSDATLTNALRTRKGHTMNIPQVEEEVAKLLSSTERMNGEMLFYHAIEGLLPREIGNGLANSNAPLPPEVTPQYVVWDLADTLQALSYDERFDRLTNRLNIKGVNHIKLVKSEVVFSKARAVEIFKEVIANGGEGVILKSPDGMWADGTSASQWKMKKRYPCKLRAVELLPGTGKNEDTFGSILCRSDDGHITVAVTGLTDAKRQHICDNEETYIGAVIEVSFKDLMTNKNGYSLFEPVYVDFRLDVAETDTLERILEITS